MVLLPQRKIEWPSLVSTESKKSTRKLYDTKLTVDFYMDWDLCLIQLRCVCAPSLSPNTVVLDIWKLVVCLASSKNQLLTYPLRGFEAQSGSSRVDTLSLMGCLESSKVFPRGGCVSPTTLESREREVLLCRHVQNLGD